LNSELMIIKTLEHLPETIAKVRSNLVVRHKS